MEQKCIRLVNFTEDLEEFLEKDSNIIISYTLKYFLVIPSSKCVTLYTIPNVIKLWTSEDEVDGCIFSDDGSQVLAILKTKSLQIFKLKTKDMKITSEANSTQLTAMLDRFGIQFVETSSVTPLKFSHQQITLLVDNKWIVGLKWLNMDQLYVTYTVQAASCVAAATSHDRVHLLTSAGNLSGYSLENGKLLGVVNINSVLRSAGHSETLSAPHQMSVSPDGSLAAIASQSCAVGVGLGFAFRSATTDTANDTASLGSATSWASTRTLGAGLDPRRRQAQYRATWDAHVKALRRARTATADGAIVCVPNPGCCVRAASATAAGIGVWLSDSGADKPNTYRVVDSRSGALVAEVPLPGDSRVVIAGLMGVADAVISSHGIAMALGNLAREKLVRKLVVAMESRSLRFLVRGDELGAVTVPMAALNDCLRQRSVDVARLALALNIQALKSALLTTPATEEATMLTQARLDNAVAYMDKMFHSINLSIQANPESTSYVAQLTHAALEHSAEVTQLIDASATPADSLRKNVQAQAARLRSYQRQHSVEEAEDALSEPDPAKHATWLRWREMEAPHVIRLAVSANQLAVAHTYLANSRGWTDSAIDAAVSAELAAWRAQLVEQRDFDGLGNVLANAGTDRVAGVRGIAESTLDATLRDQVFEYLLGRGELTEDEIATWKFLLLLEEVLDMAEPDSGGRLTLNDVTNLNDDERSLILHELYFSTRDSKLLVHLRPSVAWRYLLLSNREELLLTWVQSAFNTHSSDDEDVFSQWPVTQLMVDEVADASAMPATKDAVLDRLCAFGVFPTRDANDIDAILSRLGRVGLLDSFQSVLALPTANISVDQFKMLLTRDVMDNGDPAQAFCRLGDLEYTGAEVATLTQGRANHWFPLWLTFRALHRHPDDPRCFYKAVLDSCIYFSNGNLSGYLKETPILAIALVIYGNISLRDVLSGTVPYKQVPSEIVPYEDFLSEEVPSCPVAPEVLRSAVAEFPLMEMSLEPCNGLLNEPDITLVEMLCSSTSFDLSRLLRFLEQPDRADMPHFSHPALVAAYGHRERLTFVHYLAEARPMYAVQVLLADQGLDRPGEALDTQTISEACGLAHGLALQRLGEREVSAACVALMETLGSNSAALRVHLAVGHAIKAHLEAHREKDAAAKVESLLYNLVLDSPAEILPSLESALLHGCPNPAVPEHVGPAMERCRLAVTFARQHELPLPERFLRLCAHRNLWLPFVLFVQINKYPVNQVLSLAKCFKSPAIREHLAHALPNVPRTKSADAARMAKRDPRTSLYSRIGVKLGTSSSKSEPVDASPPPSMSTSVDSIASLPPAERFVPEPNESVLVTLLRCQRMSDPPRALLSAALTLGNRALAALAACLDPGSVLACMCTFVLTSLGPEQVPERLASLVAPAVEHQAWEAPQVAALLMEAVTSRDTPTLATAFRVFLPDCPLCPFSEFLDECVTSMRFEGSIMNIKLFKASCMNLKSNPSMLDGVDEDGAFLGNGFWVSATAVALANAALADGFDSAYHQLLFAQTLTAAKFGDHLPVTTPDYAHIGELLSCLSGSGVHLSVRLLCEASAEPRRAELQRCLDALCAESAFTTALAFARLAHLDLAGAVTARWMHDFLRGDAAKDAADFWRHCEADMELNTVGPTAAATFLRQAARTASSPRERYHILQLAVGWLRRKPPDALSAALEAELETETWRCWLTLDATELAACKPGRPKLLTCSRHDIMHAARGLESGAVKLEDEQNEKVDSLLAEMMDLGNLAAACRVESLFGRTSRDLHIVLTMLAIAEGERSPYELPPDLRLLLSSPRGRPPSYRRRTHLSTRSNVSVGRTDDLQAVAHNEPDDQDSDVSAMLDALSERLEHGAQVGERVALCHRVSAQLGLRFLDVIVQSTPLDLVRAAAPSADRFALAADIVAAWRISSDEVSVFVCAELAAAAGAEGDPRLWGVDADAGFRRLLVLCGPDPTPLAALLLEEAARHAAESRQELRQAVELLIRAHDCFSAACHVEGIAKVLHQARQLAAKLLQHQRWQLMVRLVTGIGRYIEMGYVFSALKQHEHFESLLVKGMDKVAGLKPALLDFLARRCPDDKDLYRMVALHFSMYEELAEMWLAEAEQELASLTATTALAVASGNAPSVPVLPNSAATRHCLATAMSGLANASRHFLRADRLARAGSAARRAELVALQTSLLAAVPATQAAHCVLELDKDAVNALVNNSFSFPQAWILTQAYGHHVDWAAPLYQHWVVKAEPGYLPDFLETVQLTPALLEDVVKRFQKESKPSSEMLRQMRELVATCTCIETKYRIASQLGFKDIVDGLLSGWELAYLKDTVWKSGYSNG